MAAEVARRTHGTLTIAINPGGKVLYPGQASLDAVRNKTVPLAFINSAFLQSIDPDLGFLNLPFAIADQTRDFSSAHPEVMRRFRAVVGVD